MIEHGYESRSVSAEQALEELVNTPLANGASLQRGFTMTELITVMVIIGILAAMVAPRFFEKNAFDSRGFYDQTISTLRYAQKTAISQHRLVCVVFTTNSISLTQVASGSACPGTSPANNLANPSGQPSYVITAPSGVTLSGFSNFNFDALGKPRDTAGVPLAAQQVITVSAYTMPIRVEMETGYVH